MRIKNLYNWETVEEWKQAVDLKIVIQKRTEEQLGEEEIEKLFRLILADCILIPIICVREGKSDFLLWESREWEWIFGFIDNKKYLFRGGKKIKYEELPLKVQTLIKNAKALSIWIASDKIKVNTPV